jgi:DNA-binding NarL/FixJ family response regulator
MKVLIADDHGLFREGMRLQLGMLASDVEVVEAESFDQLVKAAAREAHFDLILVDLGMPGMAWRDGLKVVRGKCPETPLVVVSASDDPRDISDAIDLGASGYIPKTLSGKVMLSALKLVFSGGTYLPPNLLTRPAAGREGTAKEGGKAHPPEPLTPRQQEVLALLAKGQSNKEIARALDLAEGTVKVHIAGIMKVLNVRNRTQAVVAAADLGLIPRD